MKQFRVVVNGNEYKVAIEELPDDSNVQISGGPVNEQKSLPKVNTPPSPQEPAKAQPKSAPNKQASSAGSPGNIMAAMPGTILGVHVSVGDTVVRGQSLLVLEAMKMENDIMAPADGIVEAIHTSKGASVNSGDLLMVLS